MDAQALIEVSIYARCSQFEFIRRKRSLFANDITTINENGSIEGRVLKISSGRLQRSDRGYDEKVSSVALTLRILGDADTTDSPRPRHPRRGDYDVPGITNRNTLVGIPDPTDTSYARHTPGTFASTPTALFRAVSEAFSVRCRSRE